MAADHVIGKDAIAHYNSATNASPTWVAMPSVGNLNVDLTKAEVELAERASGWLQTGGGRKQGAVTFDYLHNAGTDTVFDALLDSYLNDTPIEMAFMDQAIATTGAQGLRAPMLVTQLSQAQELDGALMFAVAVKVTRMVEGGSVIVPSWLEVSS